MTALSRADAHAPPSVLVTDIGTSSLRALLFDSQAREIPETLVRRSYQPRTTERGGSELDANEMFEAFVSGLDEVLAKLEPGTQIAAVAASSLASNVLAIDAEGIPLTPAYLYSDTRDSAAVEQLRGRFDWKPIYARTGCPLHTSYLAARLWWLKQTQPELFDRAARWVSLHEFFLLRLFGRILVSLSLASWTGLLNHARLDWDDQVLGIVGVRREQLSPLAGTKDFLAGLNQEYRARWPALAQVPFFPAWGDGATANVGSGCLDPTRVAATIGTSGAMRVVIPDSSPIEPIPQGLWLYRVDAHRSLLGGSLNNGGNVFAYLNRTLQLPGAADLEREVAALEPDAHGLTVLPFFAGERSPGYRGDARAAVIGMTFNTSPVEIVRAALEAVAYRLALIYTRLLDAIPTPREIIASGAALSQSRAWVQILADVLGQPVTMSREVEATARGAAVLALEALGLIRAPAEVAPAGGEMFTPNPVHHETYRRAVERQASLYSVLIAPAEEA